MAFDRGPVRRVAAGHSGGFVRDHHPCVRILGHGCQSLNEYAHISQHIEIVTDNRLLPSADNVAHVR